MGLDKGSQQIVSIKKDDIFAELASNLLRGRL
jgi:hypothetical protein